MSSLENCLRINEFINKKDKINEMLLHVDEYLNTFYPLNDNNKEVVLYNSELVYDNAIKYLRIPNSRMDLKGVIYAYCNLQYKNALCEIADTAVQKNPEKVKEGIDWEMKYLDNTSANDLMKKFFPNILPYNDWVNDLEKTLKGEMNDLYNKG